MPILIQESKLISFLRDFTKRQRIIISFSLLFSLSFLWLFFVGLSSISKINKSKKELGELKAQSSSIKKELALEEKIKDENIKLALQIKDKDSSLYSVQDSLAALLRQLKQHNLKCSKINQDQIKKGVSKNEKRDFSVTVVGSFNKIFSFFSCFDDCNIPIKIRDVDIRRDIKGYVDMILSFRLN